MDNKVAYPDHLIDPKLKTKDWIAKYVKAAWNDFSTARTSTLYSKRERYENIRLYAQGEQSTTPYKERFDVDSSDKKTYLNINFKPIPIFPKIRALGLARLNKVDYNVMATPIDSLAAEETEEYFEEQKAKMVVRKQMEQVAPDLVPLSPLAKKEGEAEDLDELELQRNYTHKHQMAIEMEQGITVVLEQNNFRKIRSEVRKDLFDWGVGGYREYIDSNGAIKVRKVDARQLITSHCKNPDFSDAQHIGEVVHMSISDLKQKAGDQISAEQYKVIADSVRGKYGNPSTIYTDRTNTDFINSMKVRVFDLEFFSVNENVYEKTTNKYGNKLISKASYDKRGKARKGVYDRVAYKVIYKASWIIDTDIFFDYGLCTDMKRKKSSLMDTTLSYHISASEFHEMRIVGKTEQAIPVIDELHIAWYKFQQAIAEARPKGISIEVGALESLSLGKSGKALEPMDLLDLYYKKGVILYRKHDMEGDASHYRPIEELNNGIGGEVAAWFDVVQANIQMLRDITGLNELTDGSTPDARTLTTIAEMANEATNNTLWPIIEAENRMFQSLCESVVLRIQDVAKAGKLEGYTRSLGSNTVKFVSVSPAVSNHEYGIKLENRADDIQRQKLIQRMEAYVTEGLLRFEDTILIENTDNIKVAEQILAYRIKKREEKRQQEALQMQEANAQTQIASAAEATENEMKKLQLEYDLKLRNMEREKQLEAEIKKIDVEGRIASQHVSGEGKIAQELVKQEQKRPDE